MRVSYPNIKAVFPKVSYPQQVLSMSKRWSVSINNQEIDDSLARRDDSATSYALKKNSPLGLLSIEPAIYIQQRLS